MEGFVAPQGTHNTFGIMSKFRAIHRFNMIFTERTSRYRTRC